MNSTGILDGKHAIVFGAGGSIGSAAAKEFAAEGAEVFLAGRNKSAMNEVEDHIKALGGRAQVAVVDALYDLSVNEYIAGIVKQAGSIDMVFNATGPLVSSYGNGKTAVELTAEEFMVPLTTIVKSQFITARAAARHMLKQHSGVILFLTGSPARGHVQGATAIGAAFGAIESLSENMAVELSPSGIRVVCLRTTANVDSRTIQQTVEGLAGKMRVPIDQMMANFASLNFLKVPATVSDTAKAAAFLASDRARMITGTVVNSTAGASAD